MRCRGVRWRGAGVAVWGAVRGWRLAGVGQGGGWGKGGGDAAILVAAAGTMAEAERGGGANDACVGGGDGGGNGGEQWRGGGGVATQPVVFDGVEEVESHQRGPARHKEGVST